MVKPMILMTAEEVIKKLSLEPLEGEGGLYRRTWLGPPNADGVNSGSAIYYMLTEETFSHLHQLTAAEVYHFYLGDPVELCLLYPDGSSEIVELGQDLEGGQEVQCVVPAGTWQGSRLKPGGFWALLGTTMSPAYTPDCYTHGDAKMLAAKYPERKDMIAALTG